MRHVGIDSGDGTLRHVGIKVTGMNLCEDCNQRFDSEKALSLHVKFFHGNRVFRAFTLAQNDNTCVGMTLAGNEIFRLEKYSTVAGELLQQIAHALHTHTMFLELKLGANTLAGKDAIDDLGLIIVRQDMGRTADTMFDHDE
eukprot:gnl/TRDRNA2_/TRDRNA2_178732_c0_seq1.p1 gnl/TRDRNA2_/TRDRNA2_178732_c0~~gnl/TRDRNA2_/TRDRNA2_178732_c0_seq1.p1  ORF type:complete len:142 (+),score=29.79 gnl/TRDRNA2_/TRDRNA2_178732_c0_seq1:147-572(+)